MTSKQPEPSRPTPTDMGAMSVREVVQASGLTTSLPDLLVQDTTGRAFEPVQLGTDQDIERIPEQFALLMRREPVGGASALIRANQQRILTQALDHVRQRLAASSETASTSAFLQEMQQVLRQVKGEMDQASQEREQEYARTQETLSGWQERMHHRSSGGVVRGLIGWLVGAGGHLSLPQAINLWNEREHLALKRAASQAGRAIVGQVLVEVTHRYEHLDSMTARLERLIQQALQRVAVLSASPSTGYAPWTWQVNRGIVAEVLAQHPIPEQVIASLVKSDLTSDEDALLTQIQALARQEAAQRLEGLSITHLIELEASVNPLEGTDPVIAVGQALLELVSRTPSWQVLPSVRPRTELLQVTPQGHPIYALDHLSTASYGERQDRLGFVQVQMEVALMDLRIIHEHEEPFREALRQRNFYVLDELAAEPDPEERSHHRLTRPPSQYRGTGGNPAVPTERSGGLRREEPGASSDGFCPGDPTEPERAPGMLVPTSTGQPRWPPEQATSRVLSEHVPGGGSPWVRDETEEQP
ncbi:MAG: hypothetical protein HC884_06025 [Chloroflexaceae bacterium]|nr:hypothetical protein [Chloroflexaceae bacterium]